MRCRHEPVALLGGLVRRLCHVEVEEVHAPLVLLLEPVHDGRHGLAAESSGVEKLHQLRASGRPQERDVARVIPDAVGRRYAPVWCRPVAAEEQEQGSSQDRDTRGAHDYASHTVRCAWAEGRYAHDAAADLVGTVRDAPECLREGMYCARIRDHQLQ